MSSTFCVGGEKVLSGIKNFKKKNEKSTMFREVAVGGRKSVCASVYLCVFDTTIHPNTVYKCFLLFTFRPHIRIYRDLSVCLLAFLF